jgi:hypothetical protein
MKIRVRQLHLLHICYAAHLAVADLGLALAAELTHEPMVHRASAFMYLWVPKPVVR